MSGTVDKANELMYQHQFFDGYSEFVVGYPQKLVF